jgi:hypothetical protein
LALSIFETHRHIGKYNFGQKIPAEKLKKQFKSPDSFLKCQSRTKYLNINNLDYFIPNPKGLNY